MGRKKSWKCLTALALIVTMLAPAQTAYAKEGHADETGPQVHAESREADADGFEIEDGVLKKYTGTAAEVVIPEGVTGIGNYAFNGCGNLTGVVIPKGVTSIGFSAFSDCSSLMELILPEGVLSIGSYAFHGCTSLRTVSIPEGITRIPDYGFQGCSALMNVRLPEGLESIGSGAFYDCNSLKEITIPEGVTNIDPVAFNGCSSLEEFTIPEGVTEIGNATFRYCSSLKEIVIPRGVGYFGSSAFGGCNSLTKIKVEEGNAVYDSRGNCNAVIETKSDTLIIGCKDTVIPEGIKIIGEGAFRYCGSLTEIILPKGVTSIKSEAFFACGNLKEINIPEEVTSIEYGAFSRCSSLEAVTVEEGNAVYDSRGNCNAVIETGSNTLIAGCKNTIIPEGIIGIGNQAFSGCSGLRKLDIPNGVTKMGYYAFVNCSSLEEITIPKEVTSIEVHVFAGCSGLAAIKVEEGNLVYDSRGNCNALIETETNTLLQGCQNTVIPENVTGIGSYAFWGHSNLKEINIPKGVTSIGDHAFCNCISLKKIIIPEDVTNISGYTFDGCSEELTIYGKTGSYAETYAKENNIKFSSTGMASKPIVKKTISSRNVTLSQSSFIYDGTAKTPTVTVKDGSAILREGTDYTVAYRDNIYVGTAKAIVTGKGNYTGTVTKEFTITEAAPPEQSVKDLSQCTVRLNVSSYAYDGTAKTPTVTVKDGSAVLREGTDYTVVYSNNMNAGTAKATITGKVNYKGTVTRNFAITVKKGTSHKIGSCQYKVTGTSTVSVTGGKNKKVTKVKIPQTVKIGGKTFRVTAIAGRAFKNNKKITSVEIGDKVKTIGISAFEGCTKLSRAALGKGITEIGRNAFKNCRKLGTITIKSAKLKKVGGNALKGIKPSAKIKVPAKKLSAYKKLFKNKGQGKKVSILK